MRELLGSSGLDEGAVRGRSQMIFVGVDWAEAHHDVHVMDEDAKRLGAGRLSEGVDGIARFHELVGAHIEAPGEVVIGIETDRHLFVAALVAAGYAVFAVNPMSTSRYRAHQSMIWSRGRQTNALRTTLREYYPAALVAFDDLASADALEVLRIAPTPALGRALSKAKIAGALRRGGRQRRIDQRAEEIQAALRAPQLEGSAIIATAMGASVSASVAVIGTMVTQIAVLATELEASFEQHPAAKVVRSLPGVGTILGARVLGEFGDEPNRYALRLALLLNSRI
jgi:hypothetical protein